MVQTLTGIELDAGSLNEITSEMTNSVTNRTSINLKNGATSISLVKATWGECKRAHEDDRVLGLFPQACNLFDNEIRPFLNFISYTFSSWEDVGFFVSNQVRYDGSLETGSIDRSVDEIGRESEVGGTSGFESLVEDAIDFLSGVLGRSEDSSSAGDSTRSLFEDIELTVSKSVM
jgi:hypothetical protein